MDLPGASDRSFCSASSPFPAGRLYLWFQDRLVQPAYGSGRDHSNSDARTAYAFAHLSAPWRRQQWLFLFLLRISQTRHPHRLSAAFGTHVSDPDRLCPGRISSECAALLPSASAPQPVRVRLLSGKRSLSDRFLFFPYPQATDVRQLYALSFAGAFVGTEKKGNDADPSSAVDASYLSPQLLLCPGLLCRHRLVLVSGLRQVLPPPLVPLLCPRRLSFLRSTFAHRSLHSGAPAQLLRGRRWPDHCF